MIAAILAWLPVTLPSRLGPKTRRCGVSCSRRAREVRSASVRRRQRRALHDPFQRLQFIVCQYAQITSNVEVDGL
jgi:hypothetical protein